MDTGDPKIRGASWGAWLGLLCGGLYSLGGLVIDVRTVGLNWGTLMAFGALLGMPLVFASVGFVLGWLWAALSRASD